MDLRRARAIRIDAAIGFTIAYAFGIWRAAYFGSSETEMLIFATAMAVLFAAIYVIIYRYASRHID